MSAPEKRMPPAGRDGWRLRTDEHGQRWLARPKPGFPGVEERLHLTVLRRCSYVAGHGGEPERAVLVDTCMERTASRGALSAPAVRWTAKTRETLLRQAWVSTQDGFEEGGRLDGIEEPDGSYTVTRLFACSSERSSSGVRLELTKRSGYLDGAVSLGDWHSHPRGGTRPSDDDERGWRAAARLLDRPWVGIVASAPRWGSVELAAYLTSPNGETRPIRLLNE